MPKRLTDKEFALLPEAKQKQILQAREYFKRPDVKERRKMYLEINKEHIKKTSKEYHKKYTIENKEKIQAYQKEYKEANKEAISEMRKEKYKNMSPDEKKKRIIYQKNYREKNKEAIAEANRERFKKWAAQNKEHIQKYQKEYNEANKEAILEKKKIYYQENKEKFFEYYEKNKEYFQEYRKKYNKTDIRIKGNKINSWRHQGFRHTPEQFDAIYERYMLTNECELCSAPITNGGNKDRKCCDHHHLSGSFRNVICPKCNRMRETYDKKRIMMIGELHRYFCLHTAKVP